MKPILFNTEMVRAILDGRKTVTRRVVKPANPFGNREGYRQGSGLWIDGYSKDDEPNGHIKDYSVSPCWYRKENYIELYAPYKVNDILYVRETWALEGESENYITGEKRTYYAYKADPFKRNGNWRPSIHMPKEAARIFLKVTGVRVERLQDIPESEAEKEGCINDVEYWVGNTARQHFRKLWDSTIKKEQLQYYSWLSNPYVWVIEFEVIDKAAALKEGLA